MEHFTNAMFDLVQDNGKILFMGSIAGIIAYKTQKEEITSSNRIFPPSRVLLFIKPLSIYYFYAHRKGRNPPLKPCVSPVEKMPMII